MCKGDLTRILSLLVVLAALAGCGGGDGALTVYSGREEELVWGDALSGSRARAKLYVGYLRHKLAEAGAEETLIETVRGFGYRYRPRAA